MRSSCVRHPPNHRLILIRQWQVEFCDGDHCAAALLSFFEYWHNIRLDMSQKAKEMNNVAEMHGDPPTQDDSLCQFHNAEQLQIGLLNLYGEKKIREARQLLVRKGAIAEFPNPNPRYKFDKTLFFLFYPERINAWLTEHYPASSPPAGSDASPASSSAGSLRSGGNAASNGKNADGVGKNADGVGESADGVGKNAGAIPETTSEITSETTTTTRTHALSPADSNSNPSTANRSSGCCHQPASSNHPVIASSSREEFSSMQPIQPPISNPPQIPAAGSPTDTSSTLLFDFNLATLSQAEQAQLSQRLARLPHTLAQQVLDEYNSAIGRRITFHVSRQAWLEGVIRAAQADQFTPTSDLAERRQTQTGTAIATAYEPPKRRTSIAWQKGWEHLQQTVAPGEFMTYIEPLRATEDTDALWLEAPNPYVADWVKVHLPVFEHALRPHTEMPLRVCINWLSGNLRC